MLLTLKAKRWGATFIVAQLSFAALNMTMSCTYEGWAHLGLHAERLQSAVWRCVTTDQHPCSSSWLAIQALCTLYICGSVRATTSLNTKKWMCIIQATGTGPARPHQG